MVNVKKNYREKDLVFMNISSLVWLCESRGVRLKEMRFKVSEGKGIEGFVYYVKKFGINFICKRVV